MFEYTRNYGIVGNKKRAFGEYSNSSGSTGGNILTGLNRIETVTTSNSTQSATTNKTIISNGVITLTTIANESGTWEATGV